MIGRRAVIGLSLLCALAFSVIAVASASAENSGTTAFTCVKNAEPIGAGFSKEHCAAADAVASGATFKHVEIAAGIPTTFEATNEKTGSETTTLTNAVLTINFGGVKGTITAKKVLVHGEMENFEDPTTKAMDIKQQKVIVTLTEAVLSGPLATIEGCKIVKSEIVTNELTSTSLVNTMETEFSGPGGVFAVLKFEGCKNKELNEKGFTLSGTFKAIGDGATLETTSASTAGLKFFGQAATFTSKVTPRMVTETKGTTEAPIGATTIPPKETGCD